MASALGAQSRRLAMDARARALESVSALSLVAPRRSFSSRAAAAAAFPPRHLPASAVTSARGHRETSAAARSLVPARRSFSSRAADATVDDVVFWLKIIAFEAGFFPICYFWKAYLEQEAEIRKEELKREFLGGVERDKDEEIARLKRELAGESREGEGLINSCLV